MIKLGVIGYPLAHSLSPAMHNAALNFKNIEGIYTVLETPEDKLADTIEHMKIQNFRGFNVTIPYKVDIIKFLDEIDELAKITGAVNAVVISADGKLKGYNTDISGFINAIPQDKLDNLSGKKAAVLGTGGAARAVCSALLNAGINNLVLYARTPGKAEDLKEILFFNFADASISISQLEENLDLSDISILVNTTPVGMYGKSEGQSPVSEQSIDTLPDNAIVYDIIYRPKITKLLEYAQNRNLFTIDGTEMLVLQGAKALEYWIGQESPVDIMREALNSCFV